MSWWKSYTAVLDMPGEDKRHFVSLAIAFFLTVGAYWCLRSLKDAMFDQLVGLQWQPYAKMISMITLSLLLLAYAKAVDSWTLPHLISRMFKVYSVVFVLLTALYSINPYMSKGFFQNLGLPGMPLGWLWYLTIESCGSLLVSLFWSFAATTTSVDNAAKGYPWVIALAQLGSILGSYSAILTPHTGFVPLLLLSSLAFFLVPLFLLRTPYLVGKEKAHSKKTSLIEGLRLIVSKPYLLGVLLVATLYEIPQTIVELQMKLQAKQVYAPEQLAAFMGRFGQLTNTLPLIFATLGTSVLLQRLGVRFCLVLYPLAVLTALIVAFINPTLTTCFWVCVGIKGLSYGLHNPVKEMLFLPTSRDEKFKAKSWIDSFGGRSSKAIGSIINAPLAHSLSSLATIGTSLAACITVAWLAIAVWTGKRYVEACRQHKRSS